MPAIGVDWWDGDAVVEDGEACALREARASAAMCTVRPHFLAMLSVCVYIEFGFKGGLG